MSTATPTKSSTAEYDELITLVRQASLLGSTAALLDWDQETMMPPRGVEHRSRQLAQIASIHHRLATDPRIGDLLDACESDQRLVAVATAPEAVNIREVRRRYERHKKLPAELVEELAKVASLAHQVWAEARKASDFDRFRPWLEKIVELNRRKAECYGWSDDGEPWDALAEDYEAGCTAADVEVVFTPLRARLQDFLSDLMASSTRPSNAFNEITLPVAQQEKFVRDVSQHIGFDYSRGRPQMRSTPSA